MPSEEKEGGRFAFNVAKKQWEHWADCLWWYAARAGTTGLFFHGDAPEGLTKFANVGNASFEEADSGFAVDDNQGQ